VRAAAATVEATAVAEMVEGMEAAARVAVRAAEAMAAAKAAAVMEEETAAAEKVVGRAEAAMAAGRGMDPKAALASITIDAAKVLKVDGRVGSLEVGKDGDVAMYDGDPCEYTTHCVGTVGEGKAVVKEVVVRAGGTVAGETEVVRAAEAMAAATVAEGTAVVREAAARAAARAAVARVVAMAAEAMVAATEVEDLAAAREEAGKAEGWEVEEMVEGLEVVVMAAAETAVAELAAD
jgi:hypothetical protein